MLLLTGTTDLLQIATNVESDQHATWVDTTNAGVITPGRKNNANVVAGINILGPAPAASTQRNIKNFWIRNKHATLPCSVIVMHYDGTTPETLFEIFLPVGKSLQYSDQGGFRML